MGLSPSKKTNVLFLAKIAPYARDARARRSREEKLKFLFGQFKMASKCFLVLIWLISSLDILLE